MASYSGVTISRKWLGPPVSPGKLIVHSETATNKTLWRVVFFSELGVTARGGSVKKSVGLGGNQRTVEVQTPAQHALVGLGSAALAAAVY